MQLKLKNIFTVLMIVTVLVSCKKDKDEGEPHDPVAQALIDDEKLVDYLQTHYYISPAPGMSFGVIDTILNGEESLYSKVGTESLTYNEINYKLYYLISEDGAVDMYPSRTDNVLAKYSGFKLDSTNFDKSTNFTWHPLLERIEGWKYGLPFFKGGNNVSQPGEPLTFENTGKGVIFMPSALGYADFGSGSIGANEPLIFHIELALVQRVDSDGDGIFNLYEDLNGNGDLNDDDTDKNGVPNYGDPDDDGDGKLTKDENADPNGDGNPVDALDSNGNGIKDYLDPTTK